MNSNILLTLISGFALGKIISNNKKKEQKISPQTLFNTLGNSNFAIVNVLSENIIINKNPLNINNHFGKKFIDNKKRFNFKKIVLYCANYSCAASHKYAKKLINSGVDEDKIIFYEGGILEWAKFSILYPNDFNMYNLETKKTLSTSEINKLIVSYSHFSEKFRKEKYNTPIPKLILENSPPNNDFYRDLRLTDGKITKKLNLLENKVCVVTGGTSGLGLATVYEMLDQGARHVTLTYYNNIDRAKSVEEKLGKIYSKNRFYVLRADARTTEGNKLTFDSTLRKEKLGIDTQGINCVDINAGIFGPANLHKKHVHNISEKDYKDVIELNLNAYFLAIKYFAKQAIENNISDGSIVCIKSIYGSTGSLFSNIAYQTSKHGVMGLVRQSAVELSRSNETLKIKHPIRVNAVSPTFTDTALTRPMLKTDLINETISKSNTMGKLAKKKDIANAVIYLLSDNSESITGIDLPVDCGVLAESVPTYEEVKELNNADIEELSCCGDTL